MAAVQSPITGDDLAPITDQATACDKLSELGATRAKLKQIMEWMVDSDGEFTTGYLEQLLAQLLVDATKNGWYVRTNPSSGILELIEYIPIDALDPTDAEDGDRIVFDGDTETWVRVATDEFYNAPTSGGTTVPDPDSGGILSAAHGLGSAPKQFACFLECNAADGNYAVGDRINAHSLMQKGSGGESRIGVNVGVSATQVFAVFMRDGSASRTYKLPDKNSTYGEVTITPAKWDVKFWAKV